METLLSYSLQDLLLFSRDTYAILLSEYLGESSVFLLLTYVLCIAILILHRRFIFLTKYGSTILQIVLLADISLFYGLFYAPINHLAILFLGLALTQMVFVLCIAACQPQDCQNSSQISLIPALTVFFIALLAFVLEHLLEQTAVPILPLVHPLPTLVLIFYLLFRDSNVRVVLFIIPLLLLIVESLTMLTLNSTVWWVPMTSVLLITTYLLKASPKKPSVKAC